MIDRPRKCGQAVLFDWGDTVMQVFPGCSGPMSSWPTVATVPGVETVIDEIHRKAEIALATNAASSGEREIRQALNRVGLEKRFDRVFCFETVGHKKPTPEFFHTVLDALRLEPEQVFMVGDNYEIDVLGATAVGIPSVWLNLNSPESRSGDLHTTALGFDNLITALEDVGFSKD